MPYIPHTPETLLPRSDSKNPATTCRGLTTSGRPCRRSLASSPITFKDARLDAGAVQAFAPSAARNSDDLAVAAFYCWQHKEQATSTVSAGAKLISLKHRTSIDTLFDRLGILDVDEPRQAKHNKNQHRPNHENARSHGIERGVRKKSKPSLFALLFCMGSADEDVDYVEIVKHSKRMQVNATAEMATKPTMPDGGRWMAINTECLQPRTHQPQDRNKVLKSPSDKPSRMSAQPLSYLYGFVPSTLPPQIASQLLAEASKPISELDENGYIYMFWLTDGAAPSPTRSSSLLDFSSATQLSPAGSPSRLPSGANNKILVKIGRATNVQRRLSSWSRQCGYNLTLIRFYPYNPLTTPTPISSPSYSRTSLQQGQSPQLPSPDIRMMPYSHRVERLIHIELSDKRAKEIRCGVCGKEHREWFEVDASREGLRAIDGVIRRWASWAENVYSSR